MWSIDEFAKDPSVLVNVEEYIHSPHVRIVHDMLDGYCVVYQIFTDDSGIEYIKYGMSWLHPNEHGYNKKIARNIALLRSIYGNHTLSKREFISSYCFLHRDVFSKNTLLKCNLGFHEYIPRAVVSEILDCDWDTNDFREVDKLIYEEYCKVANESVEHLIE